MPRRSSWHERIPVDVMLMDVRMPEMDGIEAHGRRIRPSPDAPRVLVLTTFDLDEYVYDGAARRRQRLRAEGHRAG